MKNPMPAVTPTPTETEQPTRQPATREEVVQGVKKLKEWIAAQGMTEDEYLNVMHAGNAADNPN